MPSKTTVSGRFEDTQGDPTPGGTIVATLVGTDAWDDGTYIVTSTESTTTDENGNWSLDLIVNGEGQKASTTWTFTGYYPGVTKVFEVRGIFIPVAVPASLTALNETSAANIRAAKDSAMVRQITAPNYEAYLALPANQRRDNDHVLIIPGV